MKRIISVLLIIILSFSGCGILPSANSTYFTYYLSTSVNSLDPQTELSASAPMVLSSIFEGLCTLDEDNIPQSGVASTWFSNANNTEYVFILRSDAYWSNGTQVTANDFLFAIERALMKETYSQYTEELFAIKNARDIYDGNGDTSDLGVEVISDTIIQFTLEDSDPNFAYTVCTEVFYPCNEEFFNSTAGRYGLSAQYLISNGAFKFTNRYAWSSGEYVELIQNTYYWNSDETTAEKITYYMKDSSGILDDPVSSLLNGKADVLELTDSEAEIATESGLTVESYYTGTTGLIFSDNSDLPVEIREIFIKAIDRDIILENIPDTAEAYGDILPYDIYFGNTSYRDLASSDMYIKESSNISSLVESALTELDWNEMPAITVICLNDDDSVALANSIITVWNKNIGAYFNIQPLSQSEYQSKINSGNYDVALTTLTSIGTTPTSFLSIFSSSNYLDDDTYNEMFHYTSGTVDDFEELESYILDNYYFYPIYSSKTHYGIGATISGVVTYNNQLDFSNATKK